VSQTSIRFRLTLWYLTALTLGISLFGALVWVEMRQQLLRNREEGMDQRLGALGRFLEFEARDNDLAAIQEEAREYSTGLPPGHGLRLFDLSGRMVFERAPGSGDHLVRSREVAARGMRFRAELSVPLDDYFRTLSILRWVLIASLPAVLIIAGGMGWWLAGRGLKPVGAMTREAREIQAKDLSARISVPETGDELQRLAESWNELLARIEASVRAVTRFTADAAHELRTPLAVIRTTSELALRHERSAEHYHKALDSIHKQTASMTDLVERLLLLAREDSGQWQFRFDAIRLGDTLRELRETLAAPAQEKAVALEWTLPREEPLVWGDADAIRRLVLILVDNSLKHLAPGGEARVSLSSNAESAVIEVSDNGSGIEPQHLPHVFERFYRADPARTAGSGAGLGLSIAKTIVEAHHAQIEIQSQAGRGTRVVVSIPVLGQADPVTAGTESAANG
jgi:two-component system heavy metal sensor histidine kinase CusS